MTDSPTREVCATLKDRLQVAEADLRKALAASEADHPLVEPARELLAIHTEIRDMLLDNFDLTESPSAPDEEPEVAMAAVQIEREAHTLKADFMDVVKALFMWKDDQVERVKNGGA